MALFRKNRGGLYASLQTTLIVKNIQELCNVIMEDLYVWGDLVVNKDNLIIEPYPNADNLFDDRIGWYTHIVTLKVGEFGVIGFLSEPLDD